MQRSRAEYLIDRLISNQLSKAELEELLAEIGKGDAQADCSDVLEHYFDYLVEQEELDNHQETPIEQKFDFSQTGEKTRPTFLRNLYTHYGQMAAVITLVAGITALLYLAPWSQSRRSASSPQVAQLTPQQEVLVPRGKRQSLRLVDGSYVRLNSDSKMSFPAVFDRAGRAVSLKGEAYFDVAKDKKRPFAISVDELKVVVLGTSFNVKAYEDEEEITVTVRSGRVSVALNANGFAPVLLTRNEKLVFNKRTEKYKLTNVNAALDCSWVDGFLQFNHTPLRTVEHTLERWYDVDIIIKDKSLYETSFTGKHLNDSLISALESICFAIDAKYEIKGRTITIHK